MQKETNIHDLNNHLSAYIEIDLSALSNNYKKISKFVSPSVCAATIKANAYGLGIDEIAKTLVKSGCREFFVSDIYEGIKLRKTLNKNQFEIYALNGLKYTKDQDYARYNIIPVLGSLNELDYYKQSSMYDNTLPVAIHIDTGFSRLGFDIEDVISICKENLNVKLLMSHLANADDTNSKLPELQLEKFLQISNNFMGVRKSIANSHAIHRGQSYHLDLVRPGISLYGCSNDNQTQIKYEQVVKMFAPILQIKEVKKGSSIGYGAAFVATKDITIAILEIGYADGIPRSLSSTNQHEGGSFYINNNAVPIIGRVSMDLVAVNITECKTNTNVGDYVEIFGTNQNIDTLAKNADTISYELLTRLNHRVQKFYKYA